MFKTPQRQVVFPSLTFVGSVAFCKKSVSIRTTIDQILRGLRKVLVRPQKQPPTAAKKDRIMARPNHNGAHHPGLMILSSHDSVFSSAYFAYSVVFGSGRPRRVHQWLEFVLIRVSFPVY